MFSHPLKGVVSVALLSLFYFTAISNPLNIADQYYQKLNQIAQDHLGIDVFQQFFDSLNKVYVPIDPNITLSQMKDQLQTKVKRNMDHIDKMIDKLNENSGLLEVKQCPRNSLPPAGYELDYNSKNYININAMCLSYGKSMNVSTDYFNQMFTYLEMNSKNIWQYFTFEDGSTVNYPAMVINSSIVDPRLRPWYVNTVSQGTKHVLLLIQKSQSINNTIIGQMSNVSNLIMDTLNPRDRVGLATFSENVSESCFSGSVASNLVISRLKAFSDKVKPGGVVNFKKAFEYGFNYLYKKNDQTNKPKVMFLLSTCERVDMSQSDIHNAIVSGEAINQNQVKIFVLCFNDEDRSKKYIWQNVTSRIYWNPLVGEGQESNTIILNTYGSSFETYDLRSNLKEYFQIYLGSLSDNRKFFSNPYFDQLNGGLVMSLCKTKETNNVIIGVGCIDLSVDDLFSEINSFIQNIEMYPFLMNSEGKIILHPYLNPPSSNFQDPLIPDITDLEISSDATQFDNLKQCVRNRGSCEAITNVTRIYPQGSFALQGIANKTVTVRYLCQPINGTEFSLCLSFDLNNPYSEITFNNVPKSQSLNFMNEISITDLSNKCSQVRRLALSDSTSIVLAPTSFNESYAYLKTQQTQVDINNWKWMVQNFNNSMYLFDTNVIEDIHITGSIEDVWRKFPNFENVTWKNFATKKGVFRKMPGTRMPKDYDATRRPWYVRSVAELGKLVLYGANIDYFMTGCYCGMTKAIPFKKNQGASKRVYASFNMVITISYMEYVFKEVFTICKQSGIVCTAVDRSGFIVLRTNSTISLTNCNNANLHLNCEEPYIAQILIRKGILNRHLCINFDDENHNITKFWNLTMDASYLEDATFQMYQIPNMNIFVIIKNKTITGDTSCLCDEKRNMIPRCNNNNYYYYYRYYRYYNN